MFNRRSLLALPALAMPAVAQAQAFPSRTINLVSGYAPGGSTDISARLVGDRMQGYLGAGARIVVENRPGAAGRIASDWLRRQPADGYVLMLVESSSHALLPQALRRGTPYDPVADFTQVAMVCTTPYVIITSNDFPARNAQELVAQLRSGAPDRLPFATSGVANATHFAAELLVNTLGRGALFPNVPYRSGGQMVESIARGETAWGAAALASAAAQIRGGRVRGIAVTSAQRSPSFPEIPTLAESGMAGFDLVNWYAIVGPPGMPAAVTETLNKAVRESLANPQLRERMLLAALDPWDAPNTVEAARAYFTAEQGAWRAYVDRTNLRLEE
jgi:tripartite-type tricarboxylate transporter receptor subunit TctC